MHGNALAPLALRLCSVDAEPSRRACGVARSGNAEKCIGNGEPLLVSKATALSVGSIGVLLTRPSSTAR